ncbi:MAG: hypothetical protein U0R26_05870 [Solirubrobacterales bacterium]
MAPAGPRRGEGVRRRPRRRGRGDDREPSRAGEWLNLDECQRLLDCYGVFTAGFEIRAGRPVAAGAAAEELGAGRAKARGPRILHKTELGAGAGLRAAR